MNPKKTKAKSQRPSRVQRSLDSVVRCYPDKIYCLFQGDCVEPFLVTRYRSKATAIVNVSAIAAPHRDYHMAEYDITPNKTLHSPTGAERKEVE